YICLSYVWGNEDKGQHILINGETFRVRRNLYKFLEMASGKSRLLREWLWIDALCIDQSNGVERNHQVQQMGPIYSSAIEVIPWLGPNKYIAEFLEDAQRLRGKETWRARGEGYHHFCSSEYWDRAWIIQEVALGHRVTLCASDAELNAELLQFEGWDHPDKVIDLSLLGIACRKN
ncbi:HET-domain-containing protein, partial [Decorospora gaudefroyi]